MKDHDIMNNHKYMFKCFFNPEKYGVEPIISGFECGDGWYDIINILIGGVF